MVRRSRNAAAKIIEQSSELGFIDGVAVGNCTARFFDPSASVGVRQDRQRFLEHLELVGTHQDRGRAAVAGDDDAVVGRSDSIDDL